MQPQEQESDTLNCFILPNLHPHPEEEHVAAAVSPPKPEEINT